MARAHTPGLKDVARHAGVSVSTVSRVINNGPYVTEAVRGKVQASMAALGYEPHSLAQSLRTGQTLTIGYVIGDIANVLFATIARGIDDELQRSAYTMFLGNSRGEAQHELQVIRHMLRRRVDGLILSLADETDAELRAYLRQPGVPLVLLDREVAGVEADRVLVEHTEGVRAATLHLHALGHRRIALVTGPVVTRPGRAIRAAFEAACADLGMPSDEGALAILQTGAALGPEALARLLDRPQRPTALIAGGVFITPQVLYAVRALGLRIPDDLSLVAYDDTDVTALHTPALTVVARNVYEIGTHAARLIIERLTGAAPAGHSRTLTIPTRLIVRGSTAPPSGES